MKIFSLIPFFIMNYLYAADVQQPDYAVKVKKTFENNLFVYDYVLTNNSSEGVNNITLGSDCTNWTIPKNFSPIFSTLVKGKTEVTRNVSSPLPKEYWSVNVNDNEDYSSPTTAVSIVSQEEKSLEKSQHTILRLVSKVNADSAYINLPVCIISSTQQWKGYAREDLWLAVDSSVDAKAVEDSCKAEVFPPSFDVSKFNPGSPMCGNNTIEFKQAGSYLINNCISQAYLENRKAKIELNQELKILSDKLKAEPSNKALKKEVEQYRSKLTKDLESQMKVLVSEMETLNSSRNSLLIALKASCEGSSKPIIVDIRPGKCEDKVNARSNNDIRVSILGTKDFNVNQIDLKKLFLNGIRPEKVEVRDIGSLYDCDNKHDGFKDIVMRFDSRNLVKSLGPLKDGESYRLMLQAAPIGGKPADKFIGFGTLTLTGAKKSKP